jgi:ubiquitin-protein ligase
MFDMEEPTQSSNSTVTHQYVHNPMECVIRGRIFPEKDPYCFASFLIQIKLPSEYPFKMPDVIILDPIYHPNVRKDGSHCHCCGYWGLDGAERWKPTTPLIEIIKAVINTIDSPHFKHPQNEECANEYQNNYETFYEKALQYTSEYGRPRY